MAVNQTSALMDSSEKAVQSGSGGTQDNPERSTDRRSIEQEATSGRHLFHTAVTTLALMTALLLVALDTNILAIAIPKITTEFGSVDDIAWYGSAYSITKMALQPTYGRLYYSMRLKTTFCTAIMLFGAGSILCALAPNSVALIFGRAIQGCGCAGITAGTMAIGTFLVSKEKFPIFVAILSSTYTISGILGPIIGGLLTQSRLTWRFCFWLNLPIGAISTFIIVFSFREPDRPSNKAPLREKLASLDPICTCILIGAVTCLILALQWGGITLPWSDSKVWGCLLGFALAVGTFIALQIQKKDRALIPIRILTQRTVLVTCAIVLLQLMTATSLTYYLPVFFQASKRLSPSSAGLYLLGFALPSPLFSFISGTIVTVTGQYVVWLLSGGAVLTVGVGLLSTSIVVSTSLGKVIGFEVLASAGFGLAVQQPLVAIRNVLDTADISMGNALIFFFQGLGTSVGLAVAQGVFINKLRLTLLTRLSENETDDIIALGATDMDRIAPELASFVAASYASAVQSVLYLSVAAAGTSFLCAWLVEWKRLERNRSENSSIRE